MNDNEQKPTETEQEPLEGLPANHGSEPVKTRRKRIATIVCGLAVAAALGGGACYALTHSPAQPAAPATATTASADSNGSTDSAESHTHDWTVTYKTVHHDAVTHTEHVNPVYENQTTYHTVCNECKQVIDGKADEHIESTGHSGYSTNVPITDEVMVSEGYDKTVTDTPAYDETVIDKMVCTTCGETKDASQAVTDATA